MMANYVDEKASHQMQGPIYGIPAYYWVHSGKIHFWPNPDKSYYIKMEYTERKTK